MITDLLNKIITYFFVKKVIVLRKHNCTLDFPKNIIDSDKTFFLNDLSKNFKDVYIFKHSNVKLINEKITFKYSLLIDNYLHVKNKETYFTPKELFLKYFTEKATIKIPERSTLVFHEWGGYYHWFCDNLPQIILLHENFLIFIF